MMLRPLLRSLAFVGVLFCLSRPIDAQNDTLATPGAVGHAARSTRALPVDTNNIPVARPAPEEALNPVLVSPPVLAPLPAPEFSATPKPVVRIASVGNPFPPALLVMVGLAGFVAYYCGLTQARNCGHTCTLLLISAMFGLLGFWVGGFAMQSGGLGDTHAALPTTPSSSAMSLDDEIGFLSSGHHWGLMGSSGFFLAMDAESRNGVALLFLSQAVFLVMAVVAAAGAALERVRILPMAIASFLYAALVYPLVANWTWGGGWLAELGREIGFGHGFVDLAGAGVIHLSGGTLALVVATDLGPRFGRFGRRAARFPAHNLPFVMIGSSLVLFALVALNASCHGGAPGAETDAGLAAANTLLAAMAGLLTSYVLVVYREKRVEPLRLCRGLLGGAVAASAASALLDPWAAVVIGAIAGWLVQACVEMLDRRGIDDPVGAIAVHGACGAWGLLALGLFADEATSGTINAVTGPVHGLFFGRGGGQLASQAIGCVTCFLVVFALSHVAVYLIQKIVGLRVDLADETTGLDLPKLGVHGYEADAEPEEPFPSETPPASVDSPS